MLLMNVREFLTLVTGDRKGVLTGSRFSPYIGNLFVSVKIWYPMKEKTSSEWYRAKKMYYGLYDTFAMFDGLGQAEDGGKGDPADAKTSPGTQPT